VLNRPCGELNPPRLQQQQHDDLKKAGSDQVRRCQPLHVAPKLLVW
jgi:hypothetical protein